MSKLQEMVKDREVWHAVVHEVAKSWTGLRTEQQQQQPLTCCHISFPVFLFHQLLAGSSPASPELLTEVPICSSCWNQNTTMPVVFCLFQ